MLRERNELTTEQKTQKLCGPYEKWLPEDSRLPCGLSGIVIEAKSFNLHLDNGAEFVGHGNNMFKLSTLDKF